MQSHWKKTAYNDYALVHLGTTKHFSTYEALYQHCVTNNINAVQA